jgi:hypothetical protein
LVARVGEHYQGLLDSGSRVQFGSSAEKSIRNAKTPHIGETLCLFLPDLRVDGDYRSPPGCEYPLFNFHYKMRYAFAAERIEKSESALLLKSGLFNGLLWDGSEIFARLTNYTINRYYIEREN